jgi:CxxC-x17-CxxC domain-containing protein
MGDFNRGNRFGGKRDFRDRNKEMFKTTCSNCGKACEVPFRPTGSKPVYCNDCFAKMRNSGQNGPERRDNRPQQPQHKEQFDALNVKLDKILRLLATPTPSEQETMVPQEVVVKEVNEPEPKAEKKATKKKTKTTKKETPTEPETA